MLRACFKAAPGHRLVVCDWAQVEARKLAWAAEDDDALHRFRLFDKGDKVNGDPYVAAACSIYGGRPADYFEPDPEKPGRFKLTREGKPKRQVGKSAELGCGYQMGAGGFEAYATKNGADWDELFPITPDDVVRAWRTLHAPIVQFWYALQEAFAEVTESGGELECGPYTIAKIDGLVVNRLPSGRLIAYQGMSCSWEKNQWGREVPSLKYRSRKGHEHTFGGKLVENATQASCACLLRRAQVECERIGLPVVLTVHDEIVCEVPEREADDALEALQDIMQDVPAWCEGMPLTATGFHCDRYRKE